MTSVNCDTAAEIAVKLLFSAADWRLIRKELRQSLASHFNSLTTFNVCVCALNDVSVQCLQAVFVRACAVVHKHRAVHVP